MTKRSRDRSGERTCGKEIMGDERLLWTCVFGVVVMCGSYGFRSEWWRGTGLCKKKD